MTKFIFVTGGVVSSLGKGVASGIIGALLQEYGYKIRIRKLDPYFNLDSGTMRPNEHGEVFVTQDGAETDLDLGHYERFTSVNALRTDHITSGKVYADLLSFERQGIYLGKTVQVIPHVTDLIKSFIISNLESEDFVICEIGGTVGDIEAQPFLEAIRQICNDIGKEKTIFIHLTLVPYIKVAKELKTKPTQHSVQKLRAEGIQPDILLVRSEKPLPITAKQKISLYCNVSTKNVIQALDQKNIYEALIVYRKAGLCRQILEHFNIKNLLSLNTRRWDNIVYRIKNLKKTVTIGIIGKYTQNRDSYKSLVESLMHSGLELQYKVLIHWIDAKDINILNVKEKLQNCDGILVPGGFGVRDTEGKILSIQYAREKNIAFLGICFGMQLALIEYAKNVLEINDATSEEFLTAGTNIVSCLSNSAHSIDQIGGTMRLGDHCIIIQKNTNAYRVYQGLEIYERHRHRYVFNIAFRKKFEDSGIVFSGNTVDRKIVEIMELPSNHCFIGVQFHPELKSRIFAPHPLFVNFIYNSINKH